MIILHTGVYEEQILLWGEVPAGSETSADEKTGDKTTAVKTKKRKGRTAGEVSASSTNLKPYPYGAHETQLFENLKEGGVNFKKDQVQSKTMIAWLPTVDQIPVASSPLIADQPTSTASPQLSPWIITVFALSTDQALELFCACAGKQILSPGVIISRDLAFWTLATRLAGALTARQQFLPSVIRKNGDYFALWKPLLSGQDAETTVTLSGAMPSVSRALTPLPGDEGINRGEGILSPPQTPSLSVLKGFLSGIVDYLVRFQDVEKTPTEAKASRKTSKKQKVSSFDSIHDQWLYALSSAHNIMEGDSAELAQFADQVQNWQRPISLVAGAPFHLCFRLEEPLSEEDDDGNGDGDEGAGSKKRKKASDYSVSPDTGTWYVRYLLQAVSDQSLLIPAQEAWKSKGQKHAFFTKAGFNSQEYLLMSLGQASGINPEIEASLKTKAPAGYEMDSTGAFDFLTQKAIALEQAGFGVMLPAWWTRKGTKLHLSTRAQVKSPKMQGGGGLSLYDIIHFDWEVALGDEKLSYEELMMLAQLKSPLVRIRGQWVHISAEEIQAALDFWKKKAEGQATVLEVVQMALGAKKPPGTIEFEGVSATGWVADLLAQLEGRIPFEEIPVPGEFKGILRPYQIRGYSWLEFLQRWNLGACLADDMGLGKTIQTLALIQRDRHSSDHPRPVLLICPTSVVGNWQKESSRFTPDLPVMVHHGLSRAKGKAFKEEAEKQAIVISSYSLLHRDFEILKTVTWLGVILDEAQNIKNPETKQARAARSLGQSEEMTVAPYRIALTGTPVENNVGDLWSIMEFLNPGFLGRQSEFKRGFFIPIQVSGDQGAMDKLKRLTGPFILRRLKTDKTIINDLPEKMEMKVFCNLTREQASLYEAVVKDAAKALDSTEEEGIKRKGIVLATLMKLKQVCNHPAQFLGDNSAIPGRSGKLARLREMFEEILEVGDRALVFSQFAEMGEILKKHLQETFGLEVLFLHGGVTKKQRDRMIERFQNEKNGPAIFILSLKAGGTGLNLTRANHVFHFDRWWNPAVENQATDRAFRIGQTKNVQVHKFLCVGTLEEKIDDMIEAKKEVAQKVIGTGEGWLTGLSTTELKELFALSKEAVGE